MKPTLTRFKDVSAKHEGNVTSIANDFGVDRTTVYSWMDADPNFKRVVAEYRGRLFDKCLETAGHLANGIPRYDESGKFAGWSVMPDGNMLRYLLGVLGKREGFGESLDITTKGESILPEPITVEIIDRREQVD